MTNRAPAFQLYAGDVLADGDFAAMEYDERGVYFTLLCHAWLEQGIPADPKRLARLLRIPPRRFARLWEAVSACWVPNPADPERLVQPRMERVRADQREYREQRVQAGKRSAKSRASRRDQAPETDPGDGPPPSSGEVLTETEPVYTVKPRQRGAEFFQSCAASDDKKRATAVSGILPPGTGKAENPLEAGNERCLLVAPPLPSRCNETATLRSPSPPPSIPPTSSSTNCPTTYIGSSHDSPVSDDDDEGSSREGVGWA